MILTDIAEYGFTTARSVAFIGAAEVGGSALVRHHLTWCTTSPPAAASIELAFEERGTCGFNVLHFSEVRTSVVLIAKDHAHGTVRDDRVARQLTIL